MGGWWGGLAFCRSETLASRVKPSFVSGTDHADVANAVSPGMTVEELSARAVNYYDQEHRRGSDRKNKRGGVGLVTIADDLFKEDLLQGMIRMRALINEEHEDFPHRVHAVMTHGVAEIMKLDSPEERTPDKHPFRRILELAGSAEKNYEKNSFYGGALQQMKVCATEYAKAACGLYGAVPDEALEPNPFSFDGGDGAITRDPDELPLHRPYIYSEKSFHMPLAQREQCFEMTRELLVDTHEQDFATLGMPVNKVDPKLALRKYVRDTVRRVRKIHKTLLEQADATRGGGDDPPKAGGGGDKDQGGSPKGGPVGKGRSDGPSTSMPGRLGYTGMLVDGPSRRPVGVSSKIVFDVRREEPRPPGRTAFFPAGEELPMDSHVLLFSQTSPLRPIFPCSTMCGNIFSDACGASRRR